MTTSGFQRFVDGKDEEARKDLLKLVERPEEDDTLREVYNEGLKLFHKCSNELYKVPDCHRKGVMADPTWYVSEIDFSSPANFMIADPVISR
jgi:hypothetical protein